MRCRSVVLGEKRGEERREKKEEVKIGEAHSVQSLQFHVLLIGEEICFEVCCGG
jgi:hypothetical protein